VRLEQARIQFLLLEWVFFSDRGGGVAFFSSTGRGTTPGPASSESDNRKSFEEREILGKG